jgi:CRP-like cAMP-binding protein
MVTSREKTSLHSGRVDRQSGLAFRAASDVFGRRQRRTRSYVFPACQAVRGCLAGQAQRIATVATMTDSVIVRLEKAAIVRVIQQEPAFSGMFIAHRLARAIRVEADLVDQLFNSSAKRLARMLLLLANFGKNEKASRAQAWRSAGRLAAGSRSRRRRSKIPAMRRFRPSPILM